MEYFQRVFQTTPSQIAYRELYMNWFSDLDANQVELLSSILSFASVFVAAVSAPIVFYFVTRRGVSDFSSAIKNVTESATKVENITQTMETAIVAFQEKLVGIDALVNAILQKQNDEQAISDEIENSEESDADEFVDGATMRGREKLKALWN